MSETDFLDRVLADVKKLREKEEKESEVGKIRKFSE